VCIINSSQQRLYPKLLDSHILSWDDDYSYGQYLRVQKPMVVNIYAEVFTQYFLSSSTVNC